MSATVTLVLGAALLSAGPAAGSTNSVTVYANTPLLSSGITVDGTANTVVVTASGSWSVGGPYGTFGPEGSSNPVTEPCALATTAPMGALVGTFDGGASWFAIGAGPTAVTGSGNLGFAANDCTPGGRANPYNFVYFGDNSGSVTVTVTSTPHLPTPASAGSITIQSGNAPLGQSDPNVQIVSVDNTGMAEICAAPNSTGPAAVVSHPAYTVIPGTNYVGFNNTNCMGSPTVGGAGSTVYRTNFTVPSGATNVSLQLSVRADNGFMISLNGGAPFATFNAYPNPPCGDTFYGPSYPTPPSFAVITGFVPGVNTLTFTVDNCNRAGSTGLDFLGTVSYTRDTTPPVITTTNVTAEATSSSGAAVTYTATALDNIDGPVPVLCSPASGSTFPLGTTNVSCTASDKAGNQGTASLTVSVVDTTPPTLTVPANLTAEASSPNGAAVNYSAAATDLVDGVVPVTCSPLAGSTFAIGTTTVSCSATDTHNNTATASFNVTVADTTAPSVTARLDPVKRGGDDESTQQFRVVFSATDAVGVKTLTANLNGITVTNGQIVRLKLAKKGAQKVTKDDEMLQIKATSFLLTVTASDAAGNAGTATAVPVFLKHGNDGEDKNQHGKDGEDKNHTN